LDSTPSRIVVPPGGSYVGPLSGGGAGGTYTTTTGQKYHVYREPTSPTTLGGTPIIPSTTGKTDDKAVSILTGTEQSSTTDERRKAIEIALGKTFTGMAGTAALQPSGEIQYGGKGIPISGQEYFPSLQTEKYFPSLQRRTLDIQSMVGAGLSAPKTALETLQSRAEAMSGLTTTPDINQMITGLTPGGRLFQEAENRKIAEKIDIGLATTTETPIQTVLRLTGREYRSAAKETLPIEQLGTILPQIRGLPIRMPTTGALKEERAVTKIPTSLTEMNTNQLTKQIVDFNIKAENYKSVPYFARDLKQETQLGIERDKLVAVLNKSIPGIDTRGVLSTVQKTGPYTGIQGKTNSDEIINFLRSKAFLKGEQDLIKMGEKLGPGQEVNKNTWQGLTIFKLQADAFNKLIETRKATPEQIDWMKSQIPTTGNIYLEGRGKGTPDIQPIVINFPEGKQTIGVVTAPSEETLRGYKEVKPTFLPWDITRKTTLKEEKDIMRDYAKLTTVNLGKATEKKAWTEKELETINKASDVLLDLNKKYIEKNEEIMGTRGLADIMAVKIRDLQLSMADEKTIKPYQDAYDMLNQKAISSPILGIQDKINALTVEMNKNYAEYLKNPIQEKYDTTVVPIYNQIKVLEGEVSTKAKPLSSMEEQLTSKSNEIIQLNKQVELGNKDINFLNDKNKQLYEITSQKINNLSKQNAWLNVIQEGKINPEWQARLKGLGASAAQLGVISPITSVMDIGRQYGKQVERYIKGGDYMSPEILKAIPVTGLPYAASQTFVSGERAGVFNLKSYDVEQIMGTAIAGTYPISYASGFLKGAAGTAAGTTTQLPFWKQVAKLAVPTAIKGGIVGTLVTAPPVIEAVGKSWKPGGEKMTTQEFQQDVAGNLLGFMGIDLANRALYKSGYEAGELMVNKDVLKTAQIVLSEKMKGIVQEIEGKKVGSIVSEIKSKPIELPNGPKITIKGLAITENVAGQQVKEFNGIKYILSETGQYRQLPADYKGMMNTQSTIWLDAQITMPNGKIVPYKLGYFDYGGQGVYKILTDTEINLLRQGEIVFTPTKGKGWFTLQTSETGLKTQSYKIPKEQLTMTEFQTKATTGEPVKISGKMRAGKLTDIYTELYKPEGGELVPRGIREYELAPAAEARINEMFGMGVGKGKISVTEGRLVGITPPERPIRLTASQVGGKAQRLLQLEPGYTQQQMQKLYGVSPEEMFRGVSTTKISSGTAGTGRIGLDKVGVPFIKIKGDLGPLLGTDVSMPGTWKLTPEDFKGTWTGGIGAGADTVTIPKMTLPTGYGTTTTNYGFGGITTKLDTNLQYLLQTTPSSSFANMISLERLAPLTTIGPATYSMPKILTGIYTPMTEISSPAKVSGEAMISKMMSVPKVSVSMTETLSPPRVSAGVYTVPSEVTRVGTGTIETPITEILSPEIVTTPITPVPIPIIPGLVPGTSFFGGGGGGGLPQGGDYFRKLGGVKEWTVAWPLKNLPGEFFYKQKLKDYMASTTRTKRKQYSPTGKQYAQGAVDRMFGKIKGLDDKKIKDIMGRGGGGMI
jgi:hypothetical protein